MAWLTTQVEKTVEVSSRGFGQEGAIPRKYSCQGTDVSPPLDIANLPEGTKAWAIIVDDPDAPGKTFLHWTAWNLPADTTSIPEGADIGELGGREGTTDFGDVGYGGPCPPSGTHRYFFRVYALDDELDVPEGANIDELREAVGEHALAYGELLGTYAKS